MIRCIFVLTILVLFIQTAQSDNVYLHNQWVYRNVVIQITDSTATIFMGNETHTLNIKSILSIEKTDIDNSVKPSFTKLTSSISTKGLNDATPVFAAPSLKVKKVYPNSIFFVAAALSAALAYDKLAEASLISDQIDNIQSIAKLTKINQNTSSYENARTRAYVVGAVAAIAGIAFTIHALEPVTLTATPDKVNLSVNF